MITIMKGSTKKLSVTLKDDFNVVKDPSLCSNIMLRLYPENKNRVLALYGTNDADMIALGTPYELAVISGNYIHFWVDSATTLTFPPGVIIGQFTIEYIDPLFPSGKQVINGRGRLFNVIM